MRRENMRLQQIEQVIAVAEEGSIGKAAQKLFISQPSLSVSIKQLEEELGEPIFERNGKGSILTPFGNEFLAFSRPVLQQYESLNQYFSGERDRSEHRFSVANQYLKFGSSIFIELCREYADSPYVFSFIEEDLQGVISRVKKQEAEIGLIVLPEEQESMMRFYFRKNDIEYTPLACEDFAILVRSSHPLAKGPDTTVSPSDLLSYPFVIYEDINNQFQETLQTIGLKPIKQRIVVTDRASFMDVLLGTDAYAIVSHRVSAYETTKYYKGIEILRFNENRLKLVMASIRNVNRPVSPISERYMNMLKQAMKV